MATDRPTLGGPPGPLSELVDDVMTEGTVARKVVIQAIGGLITAYAVARLMGGR